MKRYSKRNFLAAGLALAASLVPLVFFRKKKSPEPAYTTFLTRDGKLVQIDMHKLQVSKKTATKADLRSWIKNHKP